MPREAKGTFPARRVDIILGGVPAAVEIHIDAKMATGLVRAHAEIPRLRGMGVKVGYSCEGHLLKVTVTGRSQGVSAKNTGNVTISGDGVANSGVILGAASVPSGPFLEAQASEETRDYGVIKTWFSVHHDMMPQVTIKLYHGHGPEESLLYRITK